MSVVRSRILLTLVWMLGSFPVVRAIMAKAILLTVVCMPIVALLKVKSTRFVQRFLPNAKAQSVIPILLPARVRIANPLLLLHARDRIAHLLLQDVLADTVSLLPDAPARIVYLNPRFAQAMPAILLLPQ